MKSIVLELGLIIISYLCGSLPTGFILGHIFGNIDIRKYGSHNIGATNVYRNLGKKIGALTLLGDILKGFLPVYLVYFLTGGETLTSLAAVAAFLGHLYPVYLKFSGGKGVATALGIFLALSPQIIVISAIIFFLTLFLFQYVSLSSIVAATSLPFLMYFTPFSYPHSYIITSIIIALMIVYRHKDNITRIVKGTEPKIGGRA